MKDGLTVDDVELELNGIAGQLGREHPDTHQGWGVAVRGLHDAQTERVRPALLVLFAAVGCVLLIAAANVANLMLARAAARRQELAVRMAFGAGHARLLRQWLAESLLVALLGTALGVLLGTWMSALVIGFAPADVGPLEHAGPSAPVLLFALVIAAATTVFTGVIGAWQARGIAVHQALTRGGRTVAGPVGARMRGVLIGGQVALTLTLLVAAVLLLRSFGELHRVELGFQPHGVVTADTRLPTGRFPLTARRPWYQLARYYDGLLTELAALPAVRAVGGTTKLPLTGAGDTGAVWLEEAARGTSLPPAEHQWTVPVNVVTPGYFAAVQMRMVRGRPFEPADRLTEEQLTNPDASRPRGVAIVNEAFAARFFRGQEPIGRSLVVFDHWAGSASTIVGAVADVRAEGVASPAEPAVYVPFGEVPGFRLSLAVRSELPADALLPVVAARLREIDPRLVVTNVRPLTDVVGGAVAWPRFTLLLVGGFALLALTLAGIGIYGVVAYLAAQRTRELGIRVALGARRSDVLRVVFGFGFRPVLLGTAAGAVGAIAASLALRGLLFGVSPFDPASAAAACALVLVVAALAATVPALRATRVDPAVVLRDE
jgi:putative ABC transport system permease protein